MAYFADLSEYSFSALSGELAAARNIGWLARSHHFEKAQPDEDLLDRVWQFCGVSVAQSRGVHECDLCAPPSTVFAQRKGIRLLLGTSEVRVFSKRGTLYAAPTLLYHYIHTHRYKPPDEFVESLREAPAPPSREYFELLKSTGLEWNKTSSPPTDSAFRLEKAATGIVRIPVSAPVFMDES